MSAKLRGAVAKLLPILKITYLKLNQQIYAVLQYILEFQELPLNLYLKTSFKNWLH